MSFFFKPEAEFTIISWDQEYYEGLEYWSDVVITYQAENTGKIDIDSFEVFFSVKCVDNIVFSGSDFELDLPKGAKRNYTIYIYTIGKQATSVSISDYNLNTY